MMLIQFLHPRPRDYLSYHHLAHCVSRRLDFCFVRVLCLANVHLERGLQLHLW